MTQSVSQSLQNDMTPVISNKVRDAVKDTVRDTVKSSLASSFRTAFESSLLPAFQIGTDRMFAQVQSEWQSYPLNMPFAPTFNFAECTHNTSY